MAARAFQKLTLDDLDLEGRRVLVRVDYNVPLEAGAGPGAAATVGDDRRIAETLPTIRKVLADGGRPILMSHLGRPKGRRDERYSLAPVARRLQELLEGAARVRLAGDCCGRAAAEAVLALGPDEVLLLENLRFHPGEEENDAELGRELASFGDVFVNDAFGASHRAHASIVGIAPHVRAAAAGYLLAKEIAALEPLVRGEPADPFVAVLGGAKVSDQVEVIENLIPRLDALLVGGAMAYTFLRALGIPTGGSRVEEDKVELARRLIASAEDRRTRIVLPIDHVAARSTKDRVGELVEVGIPDGFVGVDVGPRTLARFEEELRRARTVVWNGPVGVFENEAFREGTRVVAAILAGVAKLGATVVVGGGETAQAVEDLGAAKQVTHVSTGGGAFLELLGGKELPGIAALTERP